MDIYTYLFGLGAENFKVEVIHKVPLLIAIFGATKWVIYFT